MHEVAAFLRAFPPFDTASEDALEEVARSTEIEFFPAGALIMERGSAPPDHAYVVRAGAVELLDDGRVLDELGVGDMFGHPSMVGGMPAGYSVRAAEDLLVYLLPARAILPLLSAPGGLRFVARSMRSRFGRPGPPPAGGLEEAVPVAALVRPAVVVDPDLPVREAARRMVEERASCAVVRLAAWRLGIVTDRDLLARVYAPALSADGPVRDVMTADVRTIGPDATAESALLEMLAAGVRHLPVVDAAGEVVGVVGAVDLLSAHAQTPLRLRLTIARTAGAELAQAARRVPQVVASAVAAGQTGRQAAATLSVLLTSVTHRQVGLALERTGPPPVPFAWLVLGSTARREASLSSDVDTALVWDGDDHDPDLRSWFAELAATVHSGLRRCGVRIDDHGVSADDARFARSLDAWRAALDAWRREPAEGQAVIYLSALADAVPAWGGAPWPALREAIRAARADPAVRRLCARAALVRRPPTGFVRDLVVEHSGEHRGRLDVSRGGITLIVDLARCAAEAADADALSTPDRLAAAGAAGVLDDTDVRTLEEAHEFLTRLRLEHQVEQLENGLEPDDHLDPGELTPLTRSHVREALRAIARVQGVVESDLGGPGW
ncbi:MAG: DUF294 nucleotidyltransferase-like domain-containing protein [Actinomycetia bacterium]|nr:DUF294 nucleotidyltransferase-like domain-containing protein [Actinomycetes bacterium]